MAAKAARQAWLEVSRELRRYDLQVERERRQGDTVPRDDAEAVLQSLARTIRLELRESVLFAFAKVHPDSAAMKALESVLDAYLLAAASTVACRRMLDGSPLPAWVTNALEAELRNQFPQADLNEQATALSMILRSVLAQQVQAQATR